MTDAGLIDHCARRKLAEAVRHFCAGQTTNRGFEASVPASREWALHEIEFRGVWPFYDDIRTHKLTGPWTPTSAGKNQLARIILFLRSGQPYKNPRTTGQCGRFPAIFTFLTSGFSLSGLSFVLSAALALLIMAAIQYLRVQISPRSPVGQQEYWPFFCEADYETALSKPVYLSGRR